jgi:hypothetical protein
MSRRPWLAISLLVIAAGCATTWQVDTYQAPDADLSARRTFLWRGGDLGTVAAVDPSVAQATDLHIREVVVAGLVRKGYTEVQDAKAADMLVRYQVVGTRKVMATEKPRFNAPLPDDVLMQSNPPPPAASELPREKMVREGSVVVYVEEPASERLIWRGMISTETRTGSSEGTIHTAAEMARDIVEGFPQRAAP